MCLHVLKLIYLIISLQNEIAKKLFKATFYIKTCLGYEKSQEGDESGVRVSSDHF